MLRELQSQLKIFTTKSTILWIHSPGKSTQMSTTISQPTLFRLHKKTSVSNLRTWLKSLSIHELFSWPSMTTLSYLLNDPPMQSKVNTITITPLPQGNFKIQLLPSQVNFILSSECIGESLYSRGPCHHGCVQKPWPIPCEVGWSTQLFCNERGGPRPSSWRVSCFCANLGTGCVQQMPSLGRPLWCGYGAFGFWFVG